MSDATGAHVEVLEDEHTPGDGVVTMRVVVNGTDVGRLAEVPTIDLGDGKSTMATVTIKLVPSRLEIKGEHAREDREGFGFTAT